MGGGVGRGFSVFSEGIGSGLRDALGLGAGLREGLARSEGRADTAKSVGADWATGAVGLVDPTTKWTVMITAVTLAAVHDSQMSR